MKPNLHLKAPESFPVGFTTDYTKVFLAGSIEMGTAERWQDRVAEELLALQTCLSPILVLNPRRDDWDATWAQEPDFAPFREQVEWELEALDASEHILFYFSPGTKSPITLLELGLHVASEYAHVVVCCPPGYWRRGNVVLTCARHNRVVYDSLDAAVGALKDAILNG